MTKCLDLVQCLVIVVVVVEEVKMNVKVKVNEIIAAVAIRVVVITMGLRMILTLIPLKSKYDGWFLISELEVFCGFNKILTY